MQVAPRRALCHHYRTVGGEGVLTVQWSHGAGVPPLIDGRYRLLRRLGAGAMGVVYLAHDVFLDRPVAIKVIEPGKARDPVMIERLAKEARALAKVRHENVVQVYASGPVESSFYFAMEYVEGRSLEAAIDAGETVDVADSISLLRAIASGLGAVHDLKLVHRDIKPGNIVVELQTKRPVLIDFGLARRRSGANPRVSMIAGSPLYMAPEQAADAGGTKTTARADIYALACSAFELFTGRPVFEGDDVVEIIMAHANLSPPLLSSRRPDLRVLDASFSRALAKDPDDRHDSAIAFVDEMASAIERHAQLRKRDTLVGTSVASGSPRPNERVLVLARDDAMTREMARVASRSVRALSRNPAVEHAASASALVASLRGEPASLVLIDDEGSEVSIFDLARSLRETPGGAEVGILVVSREWLRLRPILGTLGVHDVLPKPVVVRMLASTVDRILAARPSPP